MMKDKCLIFDPDTVSAKKFVEVVSPRLESPQSEGRMRGGKSLQNGDQADWHDQPGDAPNPPPFELECLEGAFTVAVGQHYPPLFPCKSPSEWVSMQPSAHCSPSDRHLAAGRKFCYSLFCFLVLDRVFQRARELWLSMLFVVWRPVLRWSAFIA